MAKRRVSMNTIRETIRLHQDAGLSNRQIARALGISRPSVAQYLSDYRSSGLSYSAIAAMSDDELVGMLEGVKIELSERYQDLSERFEYFVKELKRTGVTLDLLWQEYKREKPAGYNRTQFCHHFQVWRETSSELTMHLEHKAGEKMFVDYPGKKFMVYDPYWGLFPSVTPPVCNSDGAARPGPHSGKQHHLFSWVHQNSGFVVEAPDVVAGCCRR